MVESARRLETGVLTPTRELQKEYWDVFVGTLGESFPLRPQSARPQDSLFLSSGRAGFEYKARVTSRAAWIQVALSMNDARREAAWFPILLSERESIDREIGSSLGWDTPRDDLKENRMAIRLDGADFQDRADWPRQHRWLLDHLELLHTVFGPRIRALKPLRSFDVSRDGP